MAIDRTAHAVLMEIIQLEELKRSTDVTKNVLATAHKLARLQTDKERTHLSSLVCGLRSSYSNMLKQVRRFRLLSSKLDKLWVLFHEFTTREGNKLCKECDTALGLRLTMCLAAIHGEEIHIEDCEGAANQ